MPKIKQISCGGASTACLDFDGFLWSFGLNSMGQLGTGNKTNFNTPQKILDIPPVLSVGCGSEHTLIITNDSNLWACGSNEQGQLCLGNTEDQVSFKQTQFSNVSKLSVGCFHTLFQNDKEDIYSCGFNENGELGLGHFDNPQITPTLIPNLPPNIIQIVSGFCFNLFLDIEGNVFSVGDNNFGQLGRGKGPNANVLKQIQNIPPIRHISCVGFSSYLLDFEGNLWSFGLNANGQLGHGYRINIFFPKKIEILKNIRQVSYGARGIHFLAKDSQNTIFVTGSNLFGQLGTGGDVLLSPEKIDSKYYSIWGDVLQSNSKSARK